MKNNNEKLLMCKKLLNETASLHCPDGTNVQAVIDQWLHAIATDSDLYSSFIINEKNKLKNDLLEILKNAGYYKNKKQFYNFLFDNCILKPTENPKFKFIDLFAGIGGIRLGAQINKGVCVFSSEFDKFAQQTYQDNFAEMPFGDIKSINENSIPDHDLLIAGFPCQPFSYAGKCEGFEDQTRGTLFFDILRILEAKKTKYAVLENVKGFKSHNQGKTMFIALKALDEAGYDTYWSIINSFDFGVPQYRERWICVAIRKDLNQKKYIFPNSLGRNSKLKDIINFDEKDKSLLLSSSEIDRINFHFANSKKEIRVKHDNSKYGLDTKKGKHGIFSYLKPDGALRFHVGDVAKTQIQEAFYASLDTYAPTIIANRVPKLWDIKRKLSVREAARLQGFPEEFIFNVSSAQAYKQLGNSVTVNVFTAIINNLWSK
jgi:DNA (cytosine-5)-methyltransferase 1